MRFQILGAVLAAVLGSQAQAQDSGRQAFIYHVQTPGGANVVCADVTNDGFGSAELWAQGFWSGLNAGAAKKVGVTTSWSGVSGEIKLYCSRHPSDLLMTAIVMTYRQLDTAKN